VQTWLIGIARRQALGRLRRRAPALADLDAVASVADPGPDPEARLLAEADREEVAAAIRRLSPAHREVLDLCFVQGLSYQEIADVLGAPLGTVKSRLNHAKRAVRLQLEGFREVEP
jgi:RNA polymerase sigma-70 factor (ECF subfamily)